MRFLPGFIVAVLLAGGAAYWYWTTTPQYSIEQVKVAVKTHDLTKFRQYFDVESVSGGLVEDFLSQPVQRITSRDSLFSGIMQGIISLVRPSLAPIVKDEIEQFVISGKFSHSGSAQPNSADTSNLSSPPVADASGGGQPTLSTFDKKFGFRNHAFRSIESLKVEGGDALAALVFHNEIYNADLVLKLELHKVENHWQVIRLTNFPEFVSKLAQLQLQH